VPIAPKIQITMTHVIENAGDQKDRCPKLEILRVISGEVLRERPARIAADAPAPTTAMRVFMISFL